LEKLIFNCLTKQDEENYKVTDLGMLECAKKLWFSSSDLNSVKNLKNLEDEIEKALVPTMDRHDVTVIDFLENSIKQSFYYGYDSTPSAFINNNLVRGVADADLVVGAICDSMQTPIPECKNLHEEQVKKA
jgi:hypothetical protein